MIKLVTAFFLVMTLGSAAEASLDSANKVWRDFRSCLKRSPQNLFVSCAREKLDSNLLAPEQNRLVQILDLGFEFTELQDCTDHHKVQPLRKVPLFYCVEIKGHKKNGAGYVVFVKSPEGLKIQAIKYKYLP